MMGRGVSNGRNALFPLHMPLSACGIEGTNCSNILIPSEHTNTRRGHAASPATERLAVVRKIIYLTKSEILYRECSRGRRGGGIPLLELYGVMLSLSSSPTLCN